MLSESEKIENVLLRPDAGYDLLPANGDLVAAEIDLMTGDDREVRLRSIIDSVRDTYDYIVVDCPPSLNMLTVNALVAADGVVIPMQCEYYALEGLTSLINTIDQINKTVNSKLEIYGLLRTMVDHRINLSNEVSQQLIDYFGDKVFRTVVPRNVTLAEAPSFGRPVLFHDKKSRGALAYLALAGEMLRREDEAAQSSA